MAKLLMLLATCIGSALNLQQATASQQDSAEAHSDPTMSLQQRSTQTEAQLVTDSIYKATGFGNTFLVTTEAGNVIIDTSLARNAKDHKALLNKIDSRDPKYIIITHGHGDHVGGVPVWKSAASKVIMQKESVEFLHYQTRLKGFFARGNAAQFGFDLSKIDWQSMVTGNYDAEIPADILFEQQHSFKLGELTFDVISMPSETLDALSVWIPERKAVFVGDLYYRSFPNIYTLRGTKPRWALDYVNSLNKVLALKPEFLIPSHGEPIEGWAEIEKTLTQYRDAILYVHDAVVAGMNAGESVESLVQTISLPENLRLPEVYGRVDWSIRGIYQGYAGWFDGNPSSMLNISKQAAYAKLIDMAGGIDAVALQAKALQQAGNDDQALAMAEMLLLINPQQATALGIRIAVYSNYLKSMRNFNSAGWLKHGIRQSNAQLETKPANQPTTK